MKPRVPLYWPLVRRCAVCGAPHASFGTGVALLKGAEGRWTCREHRPKPQQAEKRP
jgi:hypothetical protein